MWAEEARMDVIRLIASDLDATLLDDQSSSRRTLRRLSARWRRRAK